MTIYVQCINGALRVRDGQRRLRTALSAFGYANVTDVETDQQFRVQEVDGQLVVLDEDRERQRRAEDECEPRLPNSYFRGDDVVDY